jgi:hemolysin activation/secretion protein
MADSLPVSMSRPQHYWPGWEDKGGPSSTHRRRWLEKLAPLAFVDIGRAVTEDPLPGEKKSQILASVGAGVILEVRNNFTGALYYGWPLRSTEDTDKGDGRLNASLTYRF